MQKVSDPIEFLVKNVNSRATAKVSVFVLHKVNKQSNNPKTEAWHIIFIIMDIYKGIIIFREASMNFFYIVSMSMNTSVQGRPSLLQCITFQSLLLLKNFLGMRGK